MDLNKLYLLAIEITKKLYCPERFIVSSIDETRFLFGKVYGVEHELCLVGGRILYKRISPAPDRNGVYRGYTQVISRERAERLIKTVLC